MDRIDALSIPEICSLIASLLDKRDLGSCVCASKQWHSFFTPFLWKHLHARTNSYSVLAPFQQPALRISPLSFVASVSTSSVLTSSSAPISGSPVTTASPRSNSLQCQTGPAAGGLCRSSGVGTTPLGGTPQHPPHPPLQADSASSYMPLSFASALAKYGHHIYSLDIQQRDLPVFDKDSPNVAQLAVTISTDLGWSNLLRFIKSHPSLTKLTLQLKGRPQAARNGLVDLIRQLSRLRILVLHTPWEIPSSTLMDILSTAKYVDDLCVGTSTFIRIGEYELDDTDDEEDEMDGVESTTRRDIHGGALDQDVLTNTELEAGTQRSALRNLRIPGGIECSAIVNILRSSPGLRSLQLGGSIPLQIPSLCHAIYYSCPLLESLDLGHFTAFTDSVFARLIRAFGPSSRLRRLRISGTYAGEETISALADYQCQTLEELDASGGMTKISSPTIQRLLMHCSMLKRLDLGRCSGFQHLASELEASDLMLGPWACHRLEYLRLPITGCVMIHSNHDVVTSADNIPVEQKSISKSHIIDYSEQVYKQLGELRHLIVLDIGGAPRKKLVQKMGYSSLSEDATGSSKRAEGSTTRGALTWTLDSGLHHLHRLSQLATLRVSECLQEIGSAEVEWMNQYWPRLTKVLCSGPIHPQTKLLLHKHIPRLSNL